MKRENLTKSRAFTLVELMVTIFIAAIILMGIGLVLVDSHRGWWRMFERTNQGIVLDAYITRKTFDQVARQASIRRQLIDGDPYKVLGNTSLTLYYYSAPFTSLVLDRYATFRLAGSDLLLDRGNLIPGTWTPTGNPTTTTLAQNVEAVTFSVEGTALQIVLTLDDRPQRMTVTTSAYRYNDHNVE